MAENIQKKIAFRLTRASLGIALMLGILVAFIQIVMDLRNEFKQIDNNAREIFLVVQNSAQRAVHLLDSRLASEVVKGLNNYRFLTYGAIKDDNDQIMAEYEIVSDNYTSSTLWFTELLTDKIAEYEFPLVNDDNVKEGSLVLSINSDRGLAPFYNRAITIFVSGLLRNMGMAVVLILIFHYMLTRPLTTISARLASIRPDQTEGKRVMHLSRHQNDELGNIVNSANVFISAIENWQGELSQREQQLRLILDASPNQIFAIDGNGDFIFVNQMTERFYRRTGEKLIGKSYIQLHKSINTEEAKSLNFCLKRLPKMKRGSFSVEQKLTDANDDIHTMQMSFIAFNMQGKKCILVVSVDITERVKAEERVEYLAFFDTLTGLPNRNMLYEYLKKDISRAKRLKLYGALMFIDLDDFKRINDSMGHSAGDQLLIQLAKEIESNKRESDTLARLGGDEFVLCMPELHKDLDVAKKLAVELAERLLTNIRKPISIGNSEFIISASIGIILYPLEDDDLETLLSFADTAMYKAKQLGRNCYKVFEDSMADEAQSLLALESELRIAIKQKQFEVKLQPILDAKTGELVSAEALIRWNHPEKGTVSPNEFISFLEQSGMVVDVDYFVLDRVCQFIKQQKAEGLFPKNLRISVNLSANTLHQHVFVSSVQAILNSHGIKGTSIEFEITERAALQRLNEVIDKARVLQLQGITFSLDDFGTGYSSLSYLKRLPVNKIKIDKSFIKDCVHDPQDDALVSSIIAIAKRLKLGVVAEGVETQEQVEWLNAHGSVYYQGYLGDRPLSLDKFHSKYLLPYKSMIVTS